MVETVGYNALTWLGDDREPHSTDLHMVERMRFKYDGTFLPASYEIADPNTLTSPYKLTRYFTKFNTPHLGAGPDRNDLEWVCNEDLSPLSQDGKKAEAK